MGRPRKGALRVHVCACVFSGANFRLLVAGNSRNLSMGKTAVCAGPLTCQSISVGFPSSIEGGKAPVSLTQTLQPRIRENLEMDRR